METLKFKRKHNVQVLTEADIIKIDEHRKKKVDDFFTFMNNYFKGERENESNGHDDRGTDTRL